MKRMIRPTTLSPEDVLIRDLSTRWQQRLTTATELIRQNLATPLDWESIAAQCAVSPNHFHRVFSAVFGEPPAHYHRRQRLEKVVYSLYMEPGRSITDLAHDAGFSSSQALAKALRKTLGVTASEVRQDLRSLSSSTLERLYQQLGHPASTKAAPLEKHLTSAIEFRVETKPAQYFQATLCSDAGYDGMASVWQTFAPADACEAVILTAYEATDDPASLGYQVGYPCCETSANIHIPAQQFLCCDIKVSSTSGYFAAWSQLYRFLCESGMEIDSNGTVVEWVHNPRSRFSLSYDMTLMLPITDCCSTGHWQEFF